MSPSTTRGERLRARLRSQGERPLARSALHAAVAAGLVWNLSDLVRRFDRYAGLESEWAPILSTARLIIWAGALAVFLLAAWSRRPVEPSWAQARALVYCAALALLASTFAHSAIDPEATRWAARLVFFTALALGQLGWLLWIVSAPAAGSGRSRGRLRLLDVVVFNALVTVALLEVVASAWAAWKPTPLLAGSSVRERLAAARRPPGEPYFGARLNGGGFADDELFRAGPRDLVVAVIVDSFGYGTVPISRHFTTVAEEVLAGEVGDRFDRIALHNFGVPGIGPVEYALVLEEHALDTDPAVVVLCVFVGNDIAEAIAFGEQRQERYRLQDWHLFELAARLGKLMTVDSATLQRLRAVGRSETDAAPEGDAREVPAETPTFSEQEFLAIERRRIEVIDEASPHLEKRFASFFRGLEWFHDRLGDKLHVVIIPDEFQVDDSLYGRLMAAVPDPETHSRDLPQRRIRAFCQQHGLRCLDLLPELRAAQRGARTYHLRDTHWNVYGNRVAGEALARSLLARPPLADSAAAP